MKTKSQGFGLIGLLITFGVIVLMLWYSLDLLKPVVADKKTNQSAIEAAQQVKSLVETKSQQTANQLTE